MKKLSIDNLLLITKILCIADLAMILYVGAIITYAIFWEQPNYEYAKHTVLSIVLGILSCAYWILCLWLWNKYDKKTSRLIFLILFYSIYPIIYYFKLKHILTSKRQN